MSTAAPSRPVLFLRPFGYLLVAVIWTALTAVTLALSGALAFGLGSSGWSPRDMYHDVSPVAFTLELIFIAALWAALMGFLLVQLPLATAPLAALAWIYVFRSLRASYASEKLSSTRQSRDSIGPATVTGTVAMSLLPVRSSPWTDRWMRLYAVGWSPNGSLWFAGLPWGTAMFLLPGWVLWPVGPVPAVAWSLLTLAALALTVRITVRGLRSTDRRRRQRSRRRSVPLP